jgi:hypothetical protein
MSRGPGGLCDGCGEGILADEHYMLLGYGERGDSQKLHDSGVAIWDEERVVPIPRMNAHENIPNEETH